jgi:hypothetical protein
MKLKYDFPAIYLYVSVESPLKFKGKIFLLHVYHVLSFFLFFIPFVHLFLPSCLIFLSYSFHCRPRWSSAGIPNLF